MASFRTIVGISLSTLILCSGLLASYPVGYPYNLEQLNSQADVILKVVAGESKTIDDDWFEGVNGYKSVATGMKIISVIKGNMDEVNTIQFQHYTEDNDALARMYMPQSYKFEQGRTYIVLAKKTDSPAAFRQCWRAHTMKYDQGVLLASSHQRAVGKTIKEVYWSELTGFLKKAGEEKRIDSNDATYAISQLDQMSRKGYESVQHFDRLDVLQQIAPFIKHEQHEIAREAIRVLASNNPFAKSEDDVFWLATFGNGNIPGFSKLETNPLNVGGSLYWKELVSIANSDAPAETRALAIRALGRAERSDIWPNVKAWLHDADDSVREAATVLLADFPGDERIGLLKKAITSDSSEVRRMAAQAIGYGQINSCPELLEELLNDDVIEVARTAALCLVSLSLDVNREILKRNLDHEYFHIVFVNVLAAEDTEKYIDALCEFVGSNSIMTPLPHWWGGQQPWGQSWDRLLEYAKSKSEMEVQGEDFEPILDALESPVVSPKSTDGRAHVGSNIPTGIYELYITKGLPERAAEFRRICNERISYDVELYFKRIDESSKQ